MLNLTPITVANTRSADYDVRLNFEDKTIQLSNEAFNRLNIRDNAIIPQDDGNNIYFEVVAEGKGTFANRKADSKNKGRKFKADNVLIALGRRGYTSEKLSLERVPGMSIELYMLQDGGRVLPIVETEGSPEIAESSEENQVGNIATGGSEDQSF